MFDMQASRFEEDSEDGAKDLEGGVSLDAPA
jgi:hypothetical protein